VGAERNMSVKWKNDNSPGAWIEKQEASCPLIAMVYRYCAASQGYMQVSRKLVGRIVSLRASPTCNGDVIHPTVN